MNNFLSIHLSLHIHLPNIFSRNIYFYLSFSLSLYPQPITEVKQLSSLGSYLPSMLLRDIKDNPSTILHPRSQKFHGAVLNADISGFTALTERLAQNEQYGAEEITKFLNSYFTEIIDIISSFGGDVIKCKYLWIDV